MLSLYTTITDAVCFEQLILGDCIVDCSIMADVLQMSGIQPVSGIKAPALTAIVISRHMANSTTTTIILHLDLSIQLSKKKHIIRRGKDSRVLMCTSTNTLQAQKWNILDRQSPKWNILNRRVQMWYSLEPVSYTHLTLPTNREV